MEAQLDTVEIPTLTSEVGNSNHQRLERLIQATIIDVLSVYEESTKRIVTEFKLKRQDGEWNSHMTLLYDPMAAEGE